MSKHKLTLGQTEEIKELYQTGKYTQAELGTQFWISWKVISDVIRDVYWSAKVTPAICQKIRAGCAIKQRRDRPNIQQLCQKYHLPKEKIKAILKFEKSKPESFLEAFQQMLREYEFYYAMRRNLIPDPQLEDKTYSLSLIVFQSKEFREALQNFASEYLDLEPKQGLVKRKAVKRYLKADIEREHRWKF